MLHVDSQQENNFFINAEGVGQFQPGVGAGAPFQGKDGVFFWSPGFSLRSNPGLKLANAFGVIGQSSPDDAKLPS